MLFERVDTPEEAGVNSAVVLEFLQLLDKMGVDNHSFIILKDNKIAVENYTAPFSGKYAHACFSVSKGLISTAVAYAIEDKKMTLDIPIIEYFPEYCKYVEKDGRNGKVTVRDLLTMSSGKKSKFIKDMTKGNYSDDWIRYKFRKDNGFLYSNDDVYMLAKAITRIYGMSIVDMLMPRLFIPLGIEQPFWETTIEGVEAGATGLYLKAMDLAKIAYCYVNGGKWDGRQVIPEEWTRIAGGYYTDLPPYYNTSKKYGYFFWGDPNGDYRFDGMYGQWAIVFKQYNAVLVFNNQSCNVQAVIDEMWKYFPRAFSEKSDGGKTSALLYRLKTNGDYAAPKSERQAIEQDIQGKVYRMPRHTLHDLFGLQISMLPFVVSGTMPQKAKKSMNDFSFNFNKDSVFLSWSEGAEKNTIEIGLDGELRESVATLGTFKYKMMSYGEWLDERTLHISVRPIETPVTREMTFVFKRNKLKIKLNSIPTIKEFTFGYIAEVSIKPTKFVRAMLALPIALIEPKLQAKGIKKKSH